MGYAGASKTFLISWSFGDALQLDRTFPISSLEHLVQENGDDSWFFKSDEEYLAIIETRDSKLGSVLQVHCTNKASLPLFNKICQWVEEKGASIYRR